MSLPPAPPARLRAATALLAAVTTLVTCSRAATAAPAHAPADGPVTTTHLIQLDGQMLKYTAEAGRIALNDSATGAASGAIFYVAYRVKPSGAPRPVAFIWNGGPGANSLRLHLEGLGPRRVDGPRLVDNDATLLGVADLVFMDPIGTGYSRAATAADEPRFYSTLGDFAATAQFVSAWRKQHDALRAPLYLVGESFGTWRAAAVAERLGARGEPVAGIVLISGGCPVGPLQPTEIRTALRVPGWALVALHHDRLAHDVSHAPDTLSEVARRWAVERYAPALARVADLSDLERDTLATELAHFIGLAPTAIDRATLTITPRAYRDSLLRERGATLNLFDQRQTGPTPPLAYDPVTRYLHGELEYATPLAYRDLESDSVTGPGKPSVGQRWSYDSAPVTPEAMAHAAAGEGPPGAQPWVLGALAANPDLRVFVAAGRYDSFNSCWANEDLATRLPGEAARRVTFHCYESGHMIGGDDVARPLLARDLKAFIVAPPAPSPTAPRSTRR